jgi:hypothetical protein
VIVEQPLLTVRFRNGRKLGTVEEGFASALTPGDRFFFAGLALEVEQFKDTDIVVHASSKSAQAVTYGGQRMSMSTHLANRVRHMLADRNDWHRFPDDVREWLEVQDRRSIIPDPHQLLVETFEHEGRHYLCAYSFEGWNAHQSLGMLLTKRMENAGLKPLGFVANDYGIACYGLDADLVGPLAGGSAPITITIADGRGRYLARGSGQVLGLYQPGEEIDLAVAYAFPREAGNDYQALNADLLLQVYAVDATDNTRYVDGRPVGPISWSGRLPATAVTARENPESASGAAEQPCVGEGCAPEGATPVQPAVTAPAKPLASPAESAMTCCDCVRTLLWFGLLYAALLAVAMLAAFWAGWQLRERRFRQRLRRLRAK